MSFLATIWLGALGALALPVVLHLLSRGHRRRVRVGTVRLLRPGPSFRARRLRPSQPLLLLVRCLLLAALALALAEPRWWRLAGGDGEPGWVLVSPAVLAARQETGTPDLESFAARGGELRLLAAGLPRVAPDAEAAPGPLDLWSLLREADASAPPGVPFHVLVEDRESVLRGARPAFARPVELTPVTLSGETRWIRRAGPVVGDGPVPVVFGTSGLERTVFERGARTLDELRREHPEVRLEPSQPLRVVLRYAAERSDDAGYVRRALAAVAEHLAAPLEVDAAVADANELDGLSADLFIWLSPEAVPAEALERYALVLSDGLERSESCAARLADREIELRRCSEVEEADGAAVLWRDALGRPLLTAVRERGIWYRFHGRFHPLWADLVFDPAFPEWLLGLVDGILTPPRVYSASAQDVRAAGAGQLLPRTKAAAAEAARRASRGVEVGLWVAVALLFAFERWLASLHRGASTEANLPRGTS